MKKLLTPALLALGTLALNAAPSFAGHTFGLFPHVFRRHCCDRCSFCVRQYNAFSPVACGTVCLDGPATWCGHGPGLIHYSGVPVGHGCCLAPGQQCDTTLAGTAQPPVAQPAPVAAAPHLLPAGPAQPVHHTASYPGLSATTPAWSAPVPYASPPAAPGW